ncbi:hypothetical protein [Streptomyces tremellae]|uniref:Cobalt transporter n=1 Tax=Streptomyces tremellae TaxID=1124239 RepID=A0ABP7EJ71_9ACTN
MAFRGSLAALGAVAMLVFGALGVQQGVLGGGATHDGVSAAAAHHGERHGHECLRPTGHQPPNTPWT